NRQSRLRLVTPQATLLRLLAEALGRCRYCRPGARCVACDGAWALARPVLRTAREGETSSHTACRRGRRAVAPREPMERPPPPAWDRLLAALGLFPAPADPL